MFFKRRLPNLWGEWVATTCRKIFSYGLEGEKSTKKALMEWNLKLEHARSLVSEAGDIVPHNEDNKDYNNKNGRNIEI